MENKEALILTTADRTILRLLYKSRHTPLSLFRLHKTLKFSLAQLGSFVSKFLKLGIIDLQDECITFTEFGRKWLITNRIKIFLSRTQYKWQDMPNSMRKKQIKIDSLYLPSRKCLGGHFFEDIEINKT